MGTEYIPTNVTSEIISRDPTIVTDTSSFHNTRSIHSLVKISIQNTDTSQASINHNSSLPYAVSIVYYDTIDTSMT